MFKAIVLCARIRQLLDRQDGPVMLDRPPEVEWPAQHIALQLLERAPTRAAEPPGLHTVDVNSLSLVRPRSVGAEAIGLRATEQLGLEGTLEHMCFGAKEQALAMATVIAPWRRWLAAWMRTDDRLAIAPRQSVQQFVTLLPYNGSVRCVAKAMANLSREKGFVGDTLEPAG